MERALFISEGISQYNTGKCCEHTAAQTHCAGPKTPACLLEENFFTGILVNLNPVTLLAGFMKQVQTNFIAITFYRQ